MRNRSSQTAQRCHAILGAIVALSLLLLCQVLEAVDVAKCPSLRKHEWRRCDCERPSFASRMLICNFPAQIRISRVYSISRRQVRENLGNGMTGKFAWAPTQHACASGIQVADESVQVSCNQA